MYGKPVNISIFTGATGLESKIYSEALVKAQVIMSQLAGLAATLMPESYLRVDEEPDVVALDKIADMTLFSNRKYIINAPAITSKSTFLKKTSSEYKAVNTPYITVYTISLLSSLTLAVNDFLQYNSFSFTDFFKYNTIL